MNHAGHGMERGESAHNGANNAGSPGAGASSARGMAGIYWEVLPHAKTTDCAGGCCYNAMKDDCENPDCTCHDDMIVRGEN